MFNPLTRIHHRNGAYIVILALIFPACLLVMGAMVDIGLFYRSRAHLQNVADAAALAGAADLPNCTVAAATARYYLLSPSGLAPYHNYIPNLTDLTVDFSGDGQNFSATGSRFCRVKLTAPAQSAIMKNVLGRTTNITVRAVAAKENTGYAIFADEGNNIPGSPPSSLRLSLSASKIYGNVHSNNNVFDQLDITSRIEGTTTVVGVVTTTSNYLHANIVDTKPPMPDLRKQPGRQIDITSPLVLSDSSALGTKKNPLIYIKKSGEMQVSIRTEKPCYASFYAPNGRIDFNATGQDTVSINLYGSLVGKSINLNLSGNSVIHAPDDASSSFVRLVQ